MKIDPEARAEVGEGMRWYDDDDRDLGEDFLTEVERVFQRIEAMPLTFAVLREDDRIRRAVLQRFPYVVYFVLLATDWRAAHHRGRSREAATHVLGRAAVVPINAH